MPEKKQKKSRSGGGAQRKPKKKNRGNLWIIIGIAFVVLLSGIVYLSWERPSAKKKEREAKQQETRKPETIIPPSELPKKEKEARPRIAIIIDDLGNSKRVDDEVLAIDAPLTVSVFPLLSDSKNAAEKASSNGMEVMLHLPMEPHDYPNANPGEGVLLTSMDDIAIITQLYEDIKSVPGIKGVNNHMGSKFTEDVEKMRIVLMQLKDKGLYFVDSKTSPRSKSDKTAREMGLRAGARDVFLDNQQDEDHIIGQIEELKKIARKHGSAIGIGHPYPVTIAALKKAIPGVEKEFNIVHASEIVR
ncbi:MAG: yibQ [Deltaproteobacteria bacterium]|nr:yibQ [Deltaproteobacteria bacterium]